MSGAGQDREGGALVEVSRSLVHYWPEDRAS